MGGRELFAVLILVGLDSCFKAGFGIFCGRGCVGRGRGMEGDAQEKAED